jgi:exonuclease SbcD
LGQGDLASLYSEILTAAAVKAEGLPVVLTGHLHVAGGDVSTESERRIVVGGEEAEAATLFDARAAYVALGYLHRPQVVSGDTAIRYAGSPFPMSASERTYRHSITVVDLASAGPLIEEVLVPRHAPFLRIPEIGALPIAELETVLTDFSFDAPASPGARAFVEVMVLLNRPESGITARIQKALEGKPIRLTRVQPIYPDGGGVVTGLTARAEALAELDHGDVFAELHRRRFAADPEQGLADAFQRLLIEVQGGSQA